MNDTASSTFVRRRVPAASGKFLRVGGDVFLVRGVTYGTFAPRSDGQQFPDSDCVRRDFELMRLAGINTVRTYTVPPPDVLDLALENGLRIMAGVTWAQHVAFLDDRQTRRDILRAIRAQVRSVASHPALLLAAIGNEIPPGIVRWHGRHSIERFLRAAFEEARSVAPGVLLTYVNYPPTEFLELPFQDVHSFNVYLHDETAMRDYVARLHHIAADRPLLLTECGADSQRETESGQANLAAMQARVAFSEGACGAIVFGWTDEWWRAGTSIEDWSFGLVDRSRRPKPAHAAISQIFLTAPFPDDARRQWPQVSVVVCAYNAEDTIDDCLTALERVEYPRFDIIVVDDGSTDGTASRVQKHASARLIQTSNAGLSVARNVGLLASEGDIVAYVDADVRVDPSWLMYLVQPFVTSNAVAAGGPNVVPSDDGWFAQCVARAPGAPSHVLYDDRIAEHIPGCNFAARRDALLAIGGFDPVFLRAGDDVDVCWRLQARGGRIAFSHAALVWHHHRATLSAYWRQQAGYGEGEAWLRLRHSARFSGSHVAWQGRIYSPLPFVRLLSARRLHSGMWGTAAFPSVYHTSADPLRALPHTAEWQLAGLLLFMGGLFALAVRGTTVMLVAAIVGALSLCLTVFRCALCAWQSEIDHLPPLRAWGAAPSRVVYRSLIAALHFIQPAARAYGYVRGLLHPPRTVAARTAPLPWSLEKDAPQPNRGGWRLLLGASRHECFWSEDWTTGEALLAHIVDRLRVARLGQEIRVDDGWQPNRDVSVSLGPWAWAHLQAVVEEHGRGRCLFRARVRVRPRAGILVALTVLIGNVLLAARLGGVMLGYVVSACVVMTLGVLAWRVSRDARQVLHVVASVARDHRMQRLPDTGSRQRRRQRTLPERHLVTAVVEGTRGLNRHTVGD